MYFKTSLLFTFLLISFCCGDMSAQCSGTPNAGTASALSSTVCVATTGSANVNATGLTTGSGISYQWQVSAGSSFSNVSGGGGGTSPSFSTSFLPIGTYSYQLRTTCATSALSNTSNVVVVYIRQTPTVTTAGTLTPGNNGTIVATGGTAPYTYSWSPSVSTTSVATGLNAGVHSVLVTDNGNCADSVIFNVSSPVNLWGITPFGGTSNYGVIYNCNPPLNTFTKTLDFVSATNGLEGRSLRQASNGKMYGMADYGGTNNAGVLFEYDPVTYTYVKILDFNGALNGAIPLGGLIQGNNGKLYGMTSAGGTNNKGVLFEFDPATNAYSKKLDFGTTNGESPTGDLLQAANGKFYGLTGGGGATGYGVLFEFDLAQNTYSVKVNFSQFTSIGAGPSGSLIQASNGKLYGLTAFGGALAGFGALIEYDIATNTCLAKVSFTGTNGQSGTGSLVQAGNGKLYGFTSQGGVYGDGVMFEYDPATNIYSKKVDFNEPNMLGNNPIHLMQASNGSLYGLTMGGVNYQGLLNNQGTLFEYNIAAGRLFKKIDFDGSNKGGIPIRISELMPPCNYSLTSSAGSSAVCAGSNVTLSVSGITNFSWSTGATTSSIVVNPTITTSYAITGSAPTCVTPTSAAVAVVSVDPLPTVAVNNVIVCPGNTATLTAAGASTYSWSTGGSGPTVTVSPASSSDYTVTGYSAQGCARSETVSVTVFSTPTVAVNSATICAGETATLSAWGLETYTWNTSATTSVVTVSPLGTTIYTVSGSICSVAATNTAQVWVNSLPTVAITSATVCSNRIATLQPSGATSYSVNGVANSSFTFNPVNTTTYAVTGASNNCVSGNIAIATVSVNAAPVISVTGATICSGGTATLTASGAGSYSVNGAPATSFIFSPVNTTTYAITGSGNNCVSDPVVATVSVNTTPTVTITGTTICAGETATLIPGGATSYSVNGSAASIFTFNPANTATYALTGSADNCISNVAVATVSVNARPVVSVPSVTVCSGQIVTLTPSGASSYSVNTQPNNTFTFSPVNSVKAITGSSNNCVSSNTAYATISVITAPWVSVMDATICPGATATIVTYGASSYSVNGVANSSFTFNPVNTTTYAVTGYSNTCVSMNTAIATVSVRPSPTVTVNNPVICSGKSATLIPWGAANYTVSGGQWIVAPGATTSYSITGADIHGCVSGNTAVAMVSVNVSPTVTVNSSTICSGQSATLIPGGASTYTVNGGQWTVTPYVTTYYHISGTAQNGCVAGNTAIATVSVKASPTVIASSGTICANKIFSMSVAGANTYSVNGNATTSFTFSPANTTAYLITGENNGCYSSPVNATVWVNPLPTVSVNDATICSGNSATLTAGGAHTYTISGGSFIVSPNTTATYSVSGTGMNGCVSGNTAIANVLVKPSPILSISDATICTGEEVVLTVSGASSYTWSTGVRSPSVVMTPDKTTSYSLTGTGVNGCESPALVTVYVEACTGILSARDEHRHFSVFPNPNTGEFTVECEPGLEITITDMLGRIVIRKRSDEHQTKFSVPPIAKGVYFVRAGGSVKKIRVE